MNSSSMIRSIPWGHVICPLYRDCPLLRELSLLLEFHIDPLHPNVLML